MKQLPHADAAVVQKEKVVDYLLNPLHPRGAGKAKFFGMLGYHPEQWDVLAAAFLRIAVNSAVTDSLESTHGWKYIVDGELETPSGRRAMVRTVWIVDQVGQPPRLVTAYPSE